MIRKPLQSKLKTLAFSLPVLLAVSACDSIDLNDGDITVSSNDDGDIVITPGGAGGDDGGDGGAVDGGGAPAAAGGVFAMSNILDANTIVAYSRAMQTL